MILTNATMSLHLNSLTALSKKVKGKLAYGVARNIRKLTSELTEYEEIKNNYIIEHGTESEDGRFVIEIDSDEYKKFLDFIKDFISIEHDVDIFKVSEEEIFNSDLTADEILSLDFMIEIETARNPISFS